jgi:hypothetical protein
MRHRFSRCRLRGQEGLLRAKHVQALERLEDAAGQCQLAGHSTAHLDAVQDFLRQELREHFHVESAHRDPASWASRACAGALLAGGRPGSGPPFMTAMPALYARRSAGYSFCPRPAACFASLHACSSQLRHGSLAAV